jgi:hypothetical protein
MTNARASHRESRIRRFGCRKKFRFFSSTATWTRLLLLAMRESHSRVSGSSTDIERGRWTIHVMGIVIAIVIPSASRVPAHANVVMHSSFRWAIDRSISTCSREELHGLEGRGVRRRSSLVRTGSISRCS